METQFAFPAEPLADLLPEPDHHTTAKLPKPPTGFDVLWGVAVLGLLVVSIRAFGLTQAQVPQLLRGPHGGNFWLLKLTHILFDNTLPALAALLFGAGILRYLATPNVPGSLPTPERYIRRQLWLGVFGVVNAFVLLSPADWLFQVGVLGILLFPLQRLSGRALLIGAVLTGLCFSGKAYWNYAEQRTKFTKYEQVVALEKKNKKAKLTDDQKADKAAWEGMTKFVAYDKKKDRADIIALRSDYGTAWNFLLRPLQARHAWQFYRLGIWEISSMLLLGMALFRLNIFSSNLTTSRLTLIALLCLGAGLGLAWVNWPVYEAKLIDYTKPISAGTLPWSDLLQPLERAAAAVGLAGLVLLLYRSGIGTMLWRAVGAVGQLALTNYLLQTLVCSVFFYGFGFGYFGDLRLQTLYIVVAEIGLLQLVLSPVWLRYFRLGPAEWLWQSLAYGEKLPFRRTESISITA